MNAVNVGIEEWPEYKANHRLRVVRIYWPLGAPCPIVEVEQDVTDDIVSENTRAPQRQVVERAPDTDRQLHLTTD